MENGKDATKFYFTGEPGYVVVPKDGESFAEFTERVNEMEQLRKSLVEAKPGPGSASARRPAAAGAPLQSTKFVCSEHDVPAEWVKEGVSKKTGKPYKGFWACPEYGCRQKVVAKLSPTELEAPDPTDEDFPF